MNKTWWRIVAVFLAMAVFLTVSVTGPTLAVALGVNVDAGGVVFSVMGGLATAAIVFFAIIVDI